MKTDKKLTPEQARKWAEGWVAYAQNNQVFGSLTITFEDGQITRAKLDRTVMPTDPAPAPVDN